MKKKSFKALCRLSRARLKKTYRKSSSQMSYLLTWLGPLFWLSLIAGLGLYISVNAQTSQRITKKDPLPMPIGENTYVTWSDINEMKLAMYGMASVFVLWALSQIYAAFVKRQDKTAETMEKVLEAIQKIEERFEHTPTKSEMYEAIMRFRERDP